MSQVVEHTHSAAQYRLAPVLFGKLISEAEARCKVIVGCAPQRRSSRRQTELSRIRDLRYSQGALSGSSCGCGIQFPAQPVRQGQPLCLSPFVLRVKREIVEDRTLRAKARKSADPAGHSVERLAHTVKERARLRRAHADDW